MTQKKINKTMQDNYSKLNPDGIDQIIKIMKQMVAQQDQQLEAIKQAVLHASFGDVEHGAKVIERINFFGRPLMDKYRDQPFPLAGLAFVAGIAEGKQRERERRRFARMKAEIRATKAAAKAE